MIGSTLELSVSTFQLIKTHVKAFNSSNSESSMGALFGTKLHCVKVGAHQGKTSHLTN